MTFLIGKHQCCGPGEGFAGRLENRKLDFCPDPASTLLSKSWYLINPLDWITWVCKITSVDLFHKKRLSKEGGALPTHAFIRSLQIFYVLKLSVTGVVHANLSIQFIIERGF